MLTVAKGASLEAGAEINADTLASTLKDIDASKFDKTIVLAGNKLGNVLRAGSEGSLMDGGLGADKLYGGAGADTFSYSVGGGADQVFNYDYSQGDVIKIEGTVKSSSLNGKNVVLKVGNGSLTVNNVVDKMMALEINGASNVYNFNKANTTLAKAASNASALLNQQLPADDYWFDVEPDADPLGSIIDDKDMSLNTLEEFSIPFDEPRSILVDGKARKKVSG